MADMFPGEIQALTPDAAPETAWQVPEEDRPVGWFASAASAFNREYVPANLYRMIERGTEGDYQDDPTFNGWQYLKEHKKEYADILPELENQAPERVNEAGSLEHLQANIQHLREEKQMTDTANANGFFPYLLGGIGAVALDPLSWVTAGSTTAIYKGGEAATWGARAMAFGLAAGTEQAVQEFVLQQGQDLRTAGESVSAIALSAVMGAGVGAVFGRSMAKVKGRTTPDEVARMMAEGWEEPGHVIPATPEAMAEHMKGSLSAARTDVGAEPLKGSSLGAVMDEFTPLGRAVRYVRDWVNTREAARAASPTGEVDVASAAADEAIRNHWGIVEGLMDTHLITKENMAGEATQISAEAKRNFYRTYFLRYREGMGADYTQLKKDLGQSGVLKAWKSIKQTTFENDVARYRLARENGTPEKWKPSADAEAHLKDAGARDIYMKHVKSSENTLGDFIESFKKEEIRLGLLDPEDAQDSYYWHVYNQDAIQADPDEFKALLRERFLKRPDDEWLAAREADMLEPAADGTMPTVAKPKRWRDYSKIEQDEILTEWEAVTKAHTEHYAEELRASAKSILEEGKEHLSTLRGWVTDAKHEAVESLISRERGKARLQRAEVQRLRVEVEKKAIQIEKLQNDLTAKYASNRPSSPAKKAFWDEQLGKRQGVLAEGRKWLAKRVKELESLDKETTLLEWRVERAERRLAKSQRFKDILQRNIRRTTARMRKAGQDLKKADRIEKAQARKLTLDDQVNMTFDAITNRHIAPFGRLPDDVVEKSGRMKARQIDWGDMIMQPELQDFMVLDPHRGAMMYTEDMGARLALVDNFGEESMQTVLANARDRYISAIEAARSAGKGELVDYLQKGYKRLTDDIVPLRDHFLGRMRVGDNPNHAFMWWSKQLRNVNYLRALGKVVMSSVTDPATTMLANDANLVKFMGATVRQVKNLAFSRSKLPQGELRRLISGFEVSMAYNRQVLGMGINDFATVKRGIGFGAVRKATAGVEAGLEIASNNMAKVNGMLGWNMAMRHVGGQLFMERAYKELPKFAELPSKVKAKWLRLGVSERMSERISNALKEYSHKVGDVTLPNAERWAVEDPESYRVFAMATQRLLDESLVTPGLGDLPLFMSTPMGKLLLQFQAFNFATINRYTRPLMQRAISFKEYGLLVNLTMGSALGLLGYMARMKLSGNFDKVEKQFEDLQKGKNLDLMYEALSRSPMMGHLAPMMDFGSKLVGGPVNRALDSWGVPLARLPQSSRMAERTAWTTLLGPSLGTFETLSTAVLHSANALDPNGDPKEWRRALRDFGRLAPYNNLWYLQGAVTAAQRAGAIPTLVPKKGESVY